MLDLPFKVVVPSHHRPEAILKNPLYPFAHIVVNDAEQVDQYREAAAKANVVPGNFHVCGELPSIAAVRNFMLQEVWDSATEPFFVQMDDDFLAMLPMMHWRTSFVSDPRDVLAIFWETYIAASDRAPTSSATPTSPTPRPGTLPTRSVCEAGYGR